jgi:ABC-2 type transport system permease protein
MSTATLAFKGKLSSVDGMRASQVWRAYWTEAKYEVVRAFRAPSFAIPFFTLPIVFYVLVGIFLVGKGMAHGDPRILAPMFVNWATFGVIGPGMFGFGLFVASERELGLLRLKRALPSPMASYVIAKICMTMIFALVIMITLILASVFIAHTPLSASQYVLITLIQILGSVPFCAVGLFVGTRASAKSAPAFVNLAYLPMIHMAGLFYPLPQSVQFIQFFSPVFYLNKLNLYVAGAQSIEALSFGAGPSSHVPTALCLAVLAAVTALFGALASRRLARLG